MKLYTFRNEAACRSVPRPRRDRRAGAALQPGDGGRARRGCGGDRVVVAAGRARRAAGRRAHLRPAVLPAEYRQDASELLRRAGHVPIDAMRRDFRGRAVGHEEEIVVGDLATSTPATSSSPTSRSRTKGRRWRPGMPAPSVSQSSPTPAGGRRTPGSCTSQARCTESWERRERPPRIEVRPVA